MKKGLTLAGLVLLLAFTLTAPASAQTQTVPQLINFQAYLTNSIGTPLYGPQTVIFSIYSATGASLWSEVQNVTVNKGVTDVLLGSVTSFPDNLFAGDERYLGVKVGDDPEMTPRQRITSVGYALNAGLLNGKRPFEILPPGSVIAYAGATVPDGFFECNGDPYNVLKYTDLYNAIGSIYGDKVPDYRGYFLRGWDHARGVDPGSRTGGDTVGSTQGDAFQGHYHKYHWNGTDFVAAWDWSDHYVDATFHTNTDETSDTRVKNAITDGTNGTPRTSSETRPKNINVMYIIKY